MSRDIPLSIAVIVKVVLRSHFGELSRMTVHLLPMFKNDKHFSTDTLVTLFMIHPV